MSRGEDSRARSSGTRRSTCKREGTSRPRSCAYGGGSLSSLMVTATGCRAETARGWSRPRAVSRSGRLPPCSAGSRRRGCSPSRSSAADEGRSGVFGSCCTGTKTERRGVHFGAVFPSLRAGVTNRRDRTSMQLRSSNSPRIAISYWTSRTFTSTTKSHHP